MREIERSREFIRRRRTLSQKLIAFVLSCGGVAAAQTAALIPLTELGRSTYTGGHAGGLYEKGSNEMPAGHAAAGLERAAAIQPRDRDGRLSPDGNVVMLSIGHSIAGQHFKAFAPMAIEDPRVNHSTLAILNGAVGGDRPEDWDHRDDSSYESVRRFVLSPQGLTEAQVQVVWLQVADPAPALPLPVQSADAYRLKFYLGAIARALEQRYPNLQIVYLSSSIYGGYGGLEPFAYETAFGVRFILQAQLDQMRTGSINDVRSGDLDYRRGAAPWLAWGPYLWANGSSPRVDGLAWHPEDFSFDGRHLSGSGQRKAALRMLEFFKAEPTARPWFTVPPPPRGRPARRQ